MKKTTMEDLFKEAVRLLCEWDTIAHEAMGYHTPGYAWAMYDARAERCAKTAFEEAEKAYQEACAVAGVTPRTLTRPMMCR